LKVNRLKRFMPSPALAVACIALFVALGGSAYAAVVITGHNVKNYSLTGKDIKKDGIGGVTIKESRLGTVPSADSISHSASIGSLGQLVRAKGVTGVVRTSVGRYQVVFDRNIQGCTPVASVGDTGAAGPPSGQISTTGLATNGNVLQVRTGAANDGGVADRPFNLIVSC
jgi:hypothetical protein